MFRLLNKKGIIFREKRCLKSVLFNLIEVLTRRRCVDPNN